MSDEVTKRSLTVRIAALFTRGGSAAILVLFSVTLLGLGGSIAGLGALALGRPAAGEVVASPALPALGLEAVAPERARLSPEVMVDPAVGVIWTMQVLPEDQEGREFSLRGIMEAPAGVQPGQELNMRLYYTESVSEDALEMAPGYLGLDDSGFGEPLVVASRVEYTVTGAEGSAWGYQVDLVPASLASRSVMPVGLVTGGTVPARPISAGRLFFAGSEAGESPAAADRQSPCSSRVQL